MITQFLKFAFKLFSKLRAFAFFALSLVRLPILSLARLPALTLARLPILFLARGPILCSALFFSLICTLSLSPSRLLAQRPSESLQSLAGQVQQWAEDLKSSRKDLNFMNFPEFIDKVLCPQIEKLQSASYNSLSQDEKTPFLREVVRTYGQVAEYSRDHNYFYCLYFYYKTPEAEGFLKLMAAVLNQKQQKRLLYRMKSCHREETEGNGDPLPFHSAWNEPEEEPDSKPFSHEDYKRLPYYLQKQYSNELREAVIELEKSSPPPSVKPPANQNFVLKFITEWTFLPLAFSDNVPQKCLIGGVLRDISPRGTCAPWNNPCEEEIDNFACGSIFNHACISITPVASISDRCYEASKDQPINPTEFEALQEGLRQDVSEYCRGKENTKACSLYLERLKEINQYYFSRRRPEGLRGYSRSASETEADVFCLYGQCGKTFSEFLEVIDDFSKEGSTKSSDEENFLVATAMSSYLTDLVAENATCNCENNFPCSRGCERRGKKPAHSCQGSRTETGQCMKYVNGALMRTIDVFIEPYCSFDTSSCIGQECVHEQCRGKETCSQCSVPEEPRGICNQSLSFPHAICALNLDGKDRLGVNEAKPKIEINGGVFKQCKNLEAEGEHNTALKIIHIEGEDLSLFTESEHAKFNSETRELDLLSLKDGDIVVMKSNTRHGHIEIKVPKEKCGIPADEPRTCFCSDFCEARESYTGALKPLVVFQFNPKVVSHLESLRAQQSD